MSAESRFQELFYQKDVPITPKVYERDAARLIMDGSKSVLYQIDRTHGVVFGAYEAIAGWQELWERYWWRLTKFEQVNPNPDATSVMGRNFFRLNLEARPIEGFGGDYFSEIARFLADIS